MKDVGLLSCGSGRDPTTGDSPAIAGNPVPLSRNDALGYTWRRQKLKLSEATSRDILAADKALKTRFYNVDPKPGECRIEGNHGAGYNVLYADGHVGFVKAIDLPEIRRLREACVIVDHVTSVDPSGDCGKCWP